ncbi:MAG TPA: hypothetical protein VGE74_05210 [Gemmata sp.]
MTSSVARKLFILGTSPPQGNFDAAAAIANLLSLACVIGGGYFCVSSTNSAWPFVVAFLAGVVFLWLGFAFLAISKLSSNGQIHQSYLLKRLNEQDDRIRMLEAQIAALTPQSPSPKA